MAPDGVASDLGHSSASKEAVEEHSGEESDRGLTE